MSSKADKGDSKNKGNDKGAPAFNILPHPAKSNDPADLQRPGGLRSNGPMDAFHARDPYVPSEEIRNNLPPPLSREELHAKAAQLNKDN